MKIWLFISFLMLILFTYCEKNQDETYTLRFYGDAFEDIGYSVAQVSDGYIIAGQLTDVIRNETNDIDSSNINIGIIKTGWDGDEIWKISTGGKLNDYGSKIYPLSDGSLICTGVFTDTTTALPVHTDVFVVKVSSTGEILWQKAYGGPGNQTGTDIVKTQYGFIVIGTTDVERQPITDLTGNTAGNTDIYLLKIDDNGDFIESFAYGYPGNEVCAVIKPGINEDYIVFGTTDRPDPGQAKSNLILIKINSLGYATDTKIIGGIDDEYAGDMEVLSDGYLITWTIGKEGEKQEIHASKLKTDIHASPFFTTVVKLDKSVSSVVKAMARLSDDSYVLAGQSGSGSSAKMLIFAIDPEGNTMPGTEMIKGSTGVQVAYDVISTDDGYIIAVGKNSYDVNSMITFLKFKFWKTIIN